MMTQEHVEVLSEMIPEVESPQSMTMVQEDPLTVMILDTRTHDMQLVGKSIREKNREV